MGIDRAVEIEPTGDNVIRTRDDDTIFNINGLGHEFYNLMQMHGNKIAQLDGLTGQTQTYDELLSRCVKAAKAMRAYGIKPGDVISPCTHNHLDSCVPVIAGLFIGAQIACIDIAIPSGQLSDIVHTLQPKIIFSSKEAHAALIDILKKSDNQCRVVVFGATEDESFEDFLEGADVEQSFEVYKVKSMHDCAFICLTGGSTGVCKVACLHHYTGFNWSRQYQYITKDVAVILSYSGMIWLSGIHTICVAITFGYTKLVLPKFTAADFFMFIDKYKVNAVTLAGINIPQIVKTEIPDNCNLSSLGYLQFVGSTVSKACIRQLQTILPNVSTSSGYGQTEAGGYLTFCNLKTDKLLLQNKPDTIGRPVKGCDYKVVDINSGEAVGPHHTGELLYKSKFLMLGYYKTHSSDLFDSDGWMRSGDLVYYDDDHCFYYVDRIKEMMRYRTLYVSPAYLEGVLLQHPHVKLAFVTGIPNDEDCDHPIGVVVLKENSTHVTSEELLEYVNSRVDDISQMRGGVVIVSMDAVPFTPAGKLKRYEFRKNILSERTKSKNC